MEKENESVNERTHTNRDDDWKRDGEQVKERGNAHIQAKGDAELKSGHEDLLSQGACIFFLLRCD